MTLEFIEINPTHTPTATVIWLHGLGASGDDFVPIVPQLHLPPHVNVRFLFPHAPQRPVTLNFGYVMPAWYDIYSLDRNMREDETGIAATAQTIGKLIQQENARGIPSNRIILAGFSQGGAIALHTALHYPQPLAGVIALSTYLPLHQQFGPRLSEQNKQLPIFMAHGDADSIVPLNFAELSKHLLQQQGYQVEWHIYPMAHQVCLEEIHDISKAIQAFLS